MNTLVFDIETVPDVALGRRLYGLEGLPDAQVAKAMFALRRQDTGGDFLSLEQHRVVAISCALRTPEGLRLWSLGDCATPEGELVQRFWETGAEDPAFRYNNYLSRYHWRHTDLMDVLSGFQSRGRVSLATMACLLGLPGKLGFEGSQVWDAWQGGNLAGIRRYCETDVLNTWLIYLRFAQLRGQLSREQYAEELERVKTLLRDAQEPHLAEFLRAWEAA